MKSYRVLLVIFLLVFMVACSKNSTKVMDDPNRVELFKKDFSIVKSYDEFNEHLNQRIMYNKQLEIEKEKEIKRLQELQALNDQSKEFDQDPFYNNIRIINEPQRIDVLINKQKKLPKDYSPNHLILSDLPQLDNRKHYLVDAAYSALKALIKEAEKNNHTVVVVSAYRSYQTQNSIFNNYVNRYGQKSADTYSARAGHSEHQSGLAVDVSTLSLHGSLSQKFGSTPEGIYLANHAHQYGFILRYPQNKTHITGYIYEPWHFRYVGVDLAKNIVECGCTFEEYLN